AESTFSGVRSTRLMNYSLLVGIGKSKSKEKMNRKKLRSMIARLSQALPAKVSQKAKRKQEAILTFSSVENEIQSTDDILLKE
ncbi:MAG: hypothetical protein L3J59_13630, partial [Methylococcaceae bacterium]|nr:hypothetical protein [Methylococcaceae bacterium]